MPARDAVAPWTSETAKERRTAPHLGPGASDTAVAKEGERENHNTHTTVHPLRKKRDARGAIPGFEPETPCTQSRDHTTRPNRRKAYSPKSEIAGPSEPPKI